MESEQIYAADWFSTEMSQGGRRILIRARKIAPDLYAREVLPTVLPIEHTYETSREDGLPELNERRKDYIELLLAVSRAVEQGRVGIHFYGDTIDGHIREWFYTRDIDRMMGILREHAPKWFKREVFYDDDPTWSFADGLLSQIDFDAED